MKIRKFKKEDSAEVVRLHRSTVRNVNKKDYTPKQIAVWSGRTSAKRFRKNTNKTIRYVAVEKNKIVGFGDFMLKGEIGGLYVHKDHIGKGIGKKLLKKLEQVAYKKGIREFTTIITTTSKEFYKKQGYKIIRKKLHPIGNQKLPVYLIKKRLRLSK